MFGYMIFNSSGEQHFQTPEEFQEKARQDIQNHIQKFKSNNGNRNGISQASQQEQIQPLQQPQQNDLGRMSPLLRKFHRKKNSSPLRVLQQQQAKEQRLHKIHPFSPLADNNNGNISHNNNKGDNTLGLAYVGSPLRKSITVSTIESSDDCSSIDSGKSGCSLSAASAQYLFQQQQESLSRMNTNSTFESSIFSNQLSTIYTNSTIPSTNTINNQENSIPNNGYLLLNDALPHDFEDYYSPDLDVEKFSNGRPVFTKRNLKNWELNDLRSLLIYTDLKPEWHSKIPIVQSPYPNTNFKIQIIPNFIEDTQFVECLAYSDIYKEAKFDMEFKLKTANFIVERARLRHKHLLIDSFNLDENLFDPMSNSIGNIQYDAYFKFEWRNIIENYLLNLAIEYQCRCEFKSRISRLKKINLQKKQNIDHSPSDSFRKKVLIDNNNLQLNDDLKLNVWKEVQNQVYKNLDLNGWTT